MLFSLNFCLFEFLNLTSVVVITDMPVYHEAIQDLQGQEVLEQEPSMGGEIGGRACSCQYFHWSLLWKWRETF